MMEFKVATKETRQELLALYRAAIGSEGCTWSVDYPNEELLNHDLERNGAFGLWNDEELIGAISIDEDAEVARLNCWSNKEIPQAELARLVIKESFRGQGLARQLLRLAMEELKRQGYQCVHFLVSKTNTIALRSYAPLRFERKGECDLYGEHWWCYEKRL